MGDTFDYLAEEKSFIKFKNFSQTASQYQTIGVFGPNLEELFTNHLTLPSPVEDIHILHPTTGIWSSSDVREVIQPASANYPISHHHVIITNTDNIRPLVWDQLLKTLEEARNNTTYWLLAENILNYPSTIIGRIQTQQSILPPTKARQVTELQKQYTAAASLNLEEIVEHTWPNIVLANQAIKHNLVNELKTLQHSPVTTAPQHTADLILADLAALTIAYNRKTKTVVKKPYKNGNNGAVDLKKLNPQDRALLRKLINALINYWKNYYNDLAMNQRTFASMQECARALEILDEVTININYNTPLNLLLTKLLTNLNKNWE